LTSDCRRGRPGQIPRFLPRHLARFLPHDLPLVTCFTIGELVLRPLILSFFLPTDYHSPDDVPDFHPALLVLILLTEFPPDLIAFWPRKDPAIDLIFSLRGLLPLVGAIPFFFGDFLPRSFFPFRTSTSLTVVLPDLPALLAFFREVVPFSFLKTFLVSPFPINVFLFEWSSVYSLFQN